MTREDAQANWDATISFGLKLLALLCGATGLVLVWMGIFGTIIAECTQ